MKSLPRGLVIREAGENDEADVLALLERTRGDDVGGGDYQEFFRWKHNQSPLGASPAWVATLDDALVGFRTFLRWDFVWEGQVLPAVRAVDTATHPDHQRRGIFTALTLRAVEDLTEAGVSFIFNTPNTRSGPGYLQMGWSSLGRVAIHARLRSTMALTRMLHARVPADRWSVPSDSEIAAGEVLGCTEAMANLLASIDLDRGLVTHRTPAFLAWRYGHRPLHYRIALVGREIADGLVVFRVRRRGAATEATICDVIMPRSSRRLLAPTFRRILRGTGADMAVYAGLGQALVTRSVPLGRRGPLLTWRPLAASWGPPPSMEQLTLGDIELL